VQNGAAEDEAKISPIDQFDFNVLSRAQRVLDIVLNHFFSAIPGTPFFFTDPKKAEDLRKSNQIDYDFAADFLPNTAQTVPKIFLKIKYCKG